MDVVEHGDHRTGPGQRLEELPEGPGGLLGRSCRFGEAHRLDESLRRNGAFSAGEDRRDLCGDHVGLVIVGDAGRLMDDLRNRPVRDALSVRQAAAAKDGCPFRDSRRELLDQPGLPDTRGADDREQVTGPVHRGRVERLVEQGELAITPHHR